MKEHIDEIDQMKRVSLKQQADILKLRRITLDQAAELLSRDERDSMAGHRAFDAELKGRYGIEDGDRIEPDGKIVRAPRSVEPVGEPAAAAEDVA